MNENGVHEDNKISIVIFFIDSGPADHREKSG